MQVLMLKHWPLSALLICGDASTVCHSTVRLCTQPIAAGCCSYDYVCVVCLEPVWRCSYCTYDRVCGCTPASFLHSASAPSTTFS
eukprot:3127-Heterococcus_DN1.PRE.2